MKKNIAEKSPGPLLSNFSNGGNPKYPGLMAAAISMPEYPNESGGSGLTNWFVNKILLQSDYKSRMSLLLRKGVTPVSSDIDVVIEQKRWDALTLLLDNGATPLPKHLISALNEGLSIGTFKKMLAFNLVPTNQSLQLALEKTDSRFAIELLSNLTLTDTIM